jgi:Fe-Mn family superoxide dismutase
MAAATPTTSCLADHGGRGGEPTGECLEAINRDLGGSFGEFKNRFNAASMGVFGSGWAFVTVTPSGQLAIATGRTRTTR